MKRLCVKKHLIGAIALLLTCSHNSAIAQDRVVTSSGLTYTKQNEQKVEIFKEIRVSAPTSVTQGDQFWVTYTVVSKAWGSGVEYDEMLPFVLQESKITYGEEGDFKLLNVKLRLSAPKSGTFTLPAFAIPVKDDKKRPQPTKIQVNKHPRYGQEYARGNEWLEAHTTKKFSLEVSYFDDYACLLSDNHNDCFVLVANHKYWSALGNNPILAYSDESSFPSSKVAEKDNTFTPLLGQYWSQLRRLSGNGTMQSRIRVQSYRRKSDSQPKLLGKTTWGQSEPFNTRTPERGGKHTLIGCVPLSVAQVLYRYKYPTVGESYSYYTNENNKVQRVVFDDWKPEWSNFKETYSKDASAYEVDPLARFMTWLSYGLDAEHGTSGTSAHMESVKPLLCNNLRYSGKVYLHRKISEDRMLGLIYRELDNQRPCLVDYEGHAFICDGYEGDYLHYNLGWHGFANGYYRTVLQDPSTQDCNSLFLKGVITGIEPLRQSVSKSVRLSQAGQLSEMLSLREQTTVTHLTVAGPLNNADVRLIRKMAGYDDETGSLTEPVYGSLMSLDLSQATFVTDSLTSYYSRLADNTWTWTSSDGSVAKYDMKNLTGSQWASFCDRIGVYQTGYHYNRDADGRCWENYSTAEGMISGYMFYGCTSLRHIDLPASVSEIRPVAFQNCCCLNNVSLSSGIRKVGDYAFFNCSSLDRVEYYTNTIFGKDVFKSCSPGMKP